MNVNSDNGLNKMNGAIVRSEQSSLAEARPYNPRLEFESVASKLQVDPRVIPPKFPSEPPKSRRRLPKSRASRSKFPMKKLEIPSFGAA